MNERISPETKRLGAEFVNIGIQIFRSNKHMGIDFLIGATCGIITKPLGFTHEEIAEMSLEWGDRLRDIISKRNAGKN